MGKRKGQKINKLIHYSIKLNIPYHLERCDVLEG